MRRFYYFGCRDGRAGHFLHGGSSSLPDRLDGGFPMHILDGTFTPLDANDKAWRLTQLRFGGHIISILAKHDFTVDKRPGSNACFVAVDQDPWDERRILDEAKRAFPDCWERLRATPPAPPPEPASDMLVELGKAIEEAGGRVTFDPNRKPHQGTMALLSDRTFYFCTACGRRWEEPCGAAPPEPSRP